MLVRLSSFKDKLLDTARHSLLLTYYLLHCITLYFTTIDSLYESTFKC
jgi:hypothetical protein